MKNIIVLFLIASIPLVGFAQRSGSEGRLLNEEIQNRRISFLALRLDLSMEQAIFFKEKYGEYEDKRNVINQSFESKKKHPNSEAEARALIEARFQLDEELMVAKRQFYEELSKSIPQLKLVTLPKAEEEFKQILVQRLRQNRRKGG